MDFELWLNKLVDILIGYGVAAEDGPMAALAVVYLLLTLLSLLVVVLLLRFRSRRAGETISGDEGEAATDATDATDAEDAEPSDEETSEPASSSEVPDAPPAESEQAVAEPVAAEEPVAETEVAVQEPVATESVVEEPVAVVPEPVADSASMFQRLRQGLSKTRSSLVGRVEGLLGSHAKLDEDFLEELEEILITADFGMQSTQELVAALTGRLKEIDATDTSQVRTILGEEIRRRLKDSDPEWPQPESGPLVIMVVGVNGVGKTTTIGKMAKQFCDQGKKVVLGAGDTFRAAAAEQLGVWGERSGAEVIRHSEGSDPAAVAFDAAKAAVARKADVLILDTAGRLHTKVNLMEELKKVRRVVDREIPQAPHETLLVLDATTGQNALVQAKMFQETVDVSAIALTKLDGTAKGGIVVAISSQLDLPVRLIGVGEGVEDLRHFNADEFVEALFANN